MTTDWNYFLTGFSVLGSDIYHLYCHQVFFPCYLLLESSYLLHSIPSLPKPCRVGVMCGTIIVKTSVAVNWIQLDISIVVADYRMMYWHVVSRIYIPVNCVFYICRIHFQAF